MKNLHVFGQYHQQETVHILGDVEALTALRNALDDAIANGKSSCHAEARDGEAYSVLVMCANVTDEDTLPYSQFTGKPGKHPHQYFTAPEYMKFVVEAKF